MTMTQIFQLCILIAKRVPLISFIGIKVSCSMKESCPFLIVALESFLCENPMGVD